MINFTANKEKKILETLGHSFFNLSKISEDVYWVRSADLRKFVFINSKAIKLFGLPAEAIYKDARLWLNVVLADDRDRIRQKFMECLATNEKKEPFQLQYRIHAPSGKVSTVCEFVTPVLLGKKCLGYAGFARDVSQYVSDEKNRDLAYFANFFTRALDSVFWVRDETGEKQVYISPGVEKMLGLDPQMLYDHPESWQEMILPDDRSSFSFCVEEQKKRRFRLLRKGGEVRWIEDTAFPVHNSKNELIGFAGIANDITEDVRREAELLHAKEKAEKANRAKSNFLAVMSHELRTPLNAILGMVQVLSSSKLNELQRDQVEVITNSSQALLALINDTLDFAKLEEGKLSFSNDDFDLIILLQKISVNAANLAKEKRLEWVLDIEDDLPRYVKGDPKRLRQVLINLTSNAIKYTREGRVTLSARCLRKNAKEGTFSFVVNDTGIGIPKEKLDIVFQRFEQLDSSYRRKHEGAGLGLAIVKDLVEGMGGSVAVNSNEREGSKFACLLPLNLRKKGEVLYDPTPRYESMEQQFTQFDAHILVVEDNAINQKIAIALLEQLGCTIDIVDNGEAALQKYQSGYDLIFLDIGLPDLDGFAVCEKMRENEPEGEHLPIVALTAHVFSQDRQRCFDVGMDEVMAKPVMRDDLIAVLERWVSKKVEQKNK